MDASAVDVVQEWPQLLVVAPFADLELQSGPEIQRPDLCAEVSHAPPILFDEQETTSAVKVERALWSSNAFSIKSGEPSTPLNSGQGQRIHQ